MSRKNKIIISVTGIILVLVTLIGLTYAYYLTRINGNTNDKSVTVSLANLELTYSDGNGFIEATNIVPGEVIATKTFSVENTGDKKVINYTVYLDDVINTFENKNDVKLTLTCTSSKGNKCTGTEITYPSADTLLSINDIEVEEKHNYELKVEFIETNTDQSIDMNKELSGNIIIRDLKGTGSTLTNTKGTNSVSVDNAKLLSNYRIYGNSVQGGTPTPDNPVEIKSVGDLVTDTNDSNYGKYKIGVKTTGKNIAKLSVKSSEYTYNNGIYKTVKQDTREYLQMKLQFLLDDNTHVESNVVVNENKRYSIALKAPTKKWKNLRLANNGKITESSIVIELPYELYNGKDIVISFTMVDCNVATFALKDIQLEVGTTATDYEPYNEETTNIYLTEPLRQIDNHTDYIDFKSGKVIRNTGSYIFQGNEEFANQGGEYDTNSKIFFSTPFSSNFLNGLMNNRKVQSNYFLQSTNTVQSNLDITGINFYSGKQYSNFLYFKLPKTILETLDSAGMSKWVKSLYDSRNPLLINYQINEKKENVSLPNIDLSKVKYMNIETDTNPSNIELDYIK